jgi:hypothetical protein
MTNRDTKETPAELDRLTNNHFVRGDADLGEVTFSMDIYADLEKLIASQRSQAAREVLEQFRDRFMGDMPFIVSDEEEAGRWVRGYIEQLTKQAEEGNLENE